MDMSRVEIVELRYEQARNKLGVGGSAAQGHENTYGELYQTLVRLGARSQLKKKYR